jgi:succinoglycan biosynthesis transport protein ExoP
MDSNHIQPLDYISVIRRRRWLWLSPLVASALVGWLLVKYLPREYRSSATIGVTAALVSPSLVGGSTPFDNQERLRAISQQLLSTAILARVAREEGLTAVAAVDRRIAQLRSAITITVPEPVAATNEPRRLDTFIVTYADAQPERAQRMANRLAAVFVEENSKVRTERAEDTSAFIAVQLDASQTRMAELEVRLRKSKEAHIGQLPEQTQTNLQTMSGLRQQILSNETSMRGERDRLSMIERQIDAIDKNTVDEPNNGRVPDGIVSAEGRVSALERELAAAQATYTEKHPDIVRLKSELSQARRETDAVRQQPAADRVARLERNPAYQQLVGDRETARARIKDLERDSTETQQLIRVYQARVEAAPAVEQQLSSIQRDYELERQQYADLSSKQRAATMAASVERGRSGERFAVLEPATLPTEPLKPVPIRVMLASLLGGLIVGAALTLGREYFDTSVHDERELRDEVDLPILGSIKHIPA